MPRQALCALALISILLLFTSCQREPACPSGAETPRYLSPSDIEKASQSAPAAASAMEVEINGRLTRVDEVVTGPLCNDNWKGTVYVTCDIQVLQWEEEPFFLKNCSLSIEPGTVVYVAYHNDAAYYNGCSCHTGQEPQFRKGE